MALRNVPELVLMVGFPASGKSQLALEKYPKHLLLSTDEHVQNRLVKERTSYDKVFWEGFTQSHKHFTQDLLYATSRGIDIVVDNPNMSYSHRRRILDMVPAGYKAYAHVVVCRDEEEWRRRLASRPGKTIPEIALQAMAVVFDYPTVSEGLDAVFFTDTSA
jgi:tRNA uridine 5-carbamoylmethylation protein Kti12